MSQENVYTNPISLIYFNTVTFLFIPVEVLQVLGVLQLQLLVGSVTGEHLYEKMMTHLLVHPPIHGKNKA